MNPTEYRINEGTIALIPYAHPVYETKILDKRGIFYSKKTRIQLLNEACVRTGASYKGRREAVRQLLRLRRNVPIPLCWERNICFVPSKSPGHWDCIWYMPAHIQKMTPKGKHTQLLFNNGEEIILDCSLHSTEQQLRKAAHVLICFRLNSDF